ncbi:MAG: outer membrane lipoprotein-sorting protein [Gammaproteobacteria bacterium]|nr:outer membrane lipoprotein-sorting protein [Gammaproteobacteria bacterium]
MKTDNYRKHSLLRSLQASLVTIGLLFVLTVEAANVAKDLAYPLQKPTANEIAQQVYFVNRFYAFSNASLESHPRGVAEVINQQSGEKFTVLTVERHINNTYKNEEIRSRELTIFRSGKLKGSAILMTEYEDSARNPTYTIWLPALRRIRRIEESDYDKSWGGTVFTMGEMSLRKPDDETHELLGVSTFDACLESIQLPQNKRPRWMTASIAPICEHKGKQVFQLKSKRKLDGGWYDYRVSYVDTETFADYRTEYFKDNKKVKLIDRDWRTTALGDKRALQWHHLYGKNLISGRETYIAVPDVALAIDTDRQPTFWSESTLRKLKLND